MGMGKRLAHLLPEKKVQDHGKRLRRLGTTWYGRNFLSTPLQDLCLKIRVRFYAD